MLENHTISHESRSSLFDKGTSLWRLPKVTCRSGSKGRVLLYKWVAFRDDHVYLPHQCFYSNAFTRIRFRIHLQECLRSSDLPHRSKCVGLDINSRPQRPANILTSSLLCTSPNVQLGIVE